MTAQEFVVVGVVGKPVGLRGEVYVRPNPDVGEEFTPGTTYHSDRRGTLTVASGRRHAGRLIVRFANVDSRETAEALRGTVLSLSRDAISLPDDAFWTADILGREVTDRSGDVIGVVEGTLDGAAHDYLVIARPDGGELLIPAVEELLEITDEQIVVHAIPGLLSEGDES